MHDLRSRVCRGESVTHNIFPLENADIDQIYQ